MSQIKIISQMSGDKYHFKMSTGKMWKDEFSLFRKKNGFKSLGSVNQNNTMTYKWQSNDALLKATYLRENDITVQVEIILELETIPEWYQQFLQLLYVVTSDIKTEYPIPINPISVTISDLSEKEVLKNNFMYSIQKGQFSQHFIDATLHCIDNGILTYIMPLSPLPFSSVSRYATKVKEK